MILTPDNEYAAVLDTCVLAPMPLADTLLRCAEEPALFRVFWSAESVNELHRTLLKFGLSNVQTDRRLKRMEIAFPEAAVSFPIDLLKAVEGMPDDDDRHVVSATIHARAHVIVTANLKHFPCEVLKAHDILLQSPDEFLIHQYHLNPTRMLEVLDTQAGAIGQGRTFILSKLVPSVPEFVKTILNR